MEDKPVDSAQVFMSLKRIEYLLEELIFQQIIFRSNSNEEANEKFNDALKNVNNSLKEYFDNLSR